MKFFLLLTASAILLTACSPLPIPVASVPITLPPTPSATITVPPSPTATNLPSPTLTLTPQATASDTPIPTLENTSTTIPFDPNVKQILIAYGRTGGDGTPDNAIYYGVSMPDFALYTDGQLILHTQTGLIEKTLSANEVCSLLSKIKNSGFFEAKDEVPPDDPSPWLETHRSIYQSVTATPDIGEGGNYEFLIINGEPHKSVYIYYSLTDFLIPPIRRVYDLITHYNPAGFAPYHAQRVALWIETIPPHYNDTPTPAPPTWPSTLPAIASLVAPATTGEAYVEGATAEHILALFDKLPGDGIFSDGGQPYLVVARPLLPHETAITFQYGVGRDVAVEVPFKCG